jgi:hypothetical protein
MTQSCVKASSGGEKYYKPNTSELASSHLKFCVTEQEAHSNEGLKGLRAPHQKSDQLEVFMTRLLLMLALALSLACVLASDLPAKVDPVVEARGT